MSIIEEFEHRLREDLTDDNFNGSMAAAIVRKDKVLWSGGLGYLNGEDGLPANPDTIYRVGSLAKSFTASLLLLLVQDGTVQLDDPAEKYLPEVQELEGYSESTKITFRQLASHTAGLEREPKLEKADVGPVEEWGNKVLQSIPRTSFESRPGERFSYSNIGYGILGVALSRAANQPFIELIEEKICRPLRMENSFFVLADHKRENLAPGLGGGPFGEQEVDLERPKEEHGGRGYKVPNGGLYSTASDLTKFLICHQGYGNLLERQYLELMHTKQTPEESYHGYGLGFGIYQDRNMAIVEHSGGVPGYSSYFGFEKKFGYGLVLLRNYNWGMTNWDIGPKVLLRKLVEFENKEGRPPASPGA